MIGCDILDVRKGLIIWVAYKGRGLTKTFTLVHKMSRYLLIYYEIYFAWSDEDLLLGTSYPLSISLHLLLILSSIRRFTYIGFGVIFIIQYTPQLICALNLHLICIKNVLRSALVLTKFVPNRTIWIEGALSSKIFKNLFEPP